MSVAETLEWTLGDRLAKARQVAGFSQSDMARKLDVSRALVSQWERDVASPRVEHVMAWAGACEISPQWLLGLASGYMLTDDQIPLPLFEAS